MACRWRSHTGRNPRKRPPDTTYHEVGKLPPENDAVINGAENRNQRRDPGTLKSTNTPQPSGHVKVATRGAAELLTACPRPTTRDTNRLEGIPIVASATLPVRREQPYIWATWLPRMLTSENSCEWAVWFKAHHQDWTRTPSEFNQAEWRLNHTAPLNKRKANWKHGGFDVNIEGQNSFELRGRSATLVGKPDLITQRDGQVVIVDVKTREDSASHVVQWSSTDARL